MIEYLAHKVLLAFKAEDGQQRVQCCLDIGFCHTFACCQPSPMKRSYISMFYLAEVIRMTAVPIRMLIHTSVMPITPLIVTTVVRIRILIGMTGI